ncbi:uncharacterized protein MYCFIDRAFT_155708 [Pseudocercospora fijiensis CIRAD86]|uniref:PNPLA domain-containing protein n=1 Tax=Pseudocercospora fijiensis (strain CIRAD86) TaxID=383855 RepID=M3AWN3_PSEFD|nr:uncharacterized protein MYCFIDRAFT_155708 [Pseudocercospora fijiensis CIRAD86]EME81543.1 hypothetical protein MYCFIDRAFT_155708 [Pseudocercospora fijiensis CIRAD86]
MDETVTVKRVGRKDTTKGPPLRILSLDGGGIRGYSMLIILQELMHRTFVEMEGRAPKRHEIPRPCQMFDLIAGTGTGGLIAIMLGRLRLDLDTCKDVYVRMTRRVFQTNKTVFGVPWKGTMFKASLLEEVIREVVREHTVFDDEGNDTLANATPMSPNTPPNPNIPPIPHRTLSQSSRYSQIGMTPMSNPRSSMSFGGRGNPNALLYDTRENRTKTAVFAVLRGTSVINMLRSYDSRKEPAPDVNCTIWQAGRATSATQMAFKPIQIGQSVYLDEGAGKYNPSAMVLDEAVCNEWPGREVGVFISIGTGKRPPTSNRNQHEWWEDFLGGSMGEFAEARRKLMAKIEGCEESHKFMLREHLATRGVNPENYFRLNVEVGVGEFGMDEWNRLADISTSTRQYIQRKDVEAMTCSAASKIAKIHFAKIRYDRAEARKHAGTDGSQFAQQNPWDRPINTIPPPQNFAVEMEGDSQYRPGQHYSANSSYVHRPSIADQKYTVTGDGYDSYPPQGYSSQQNPARVSFENSGSVRFSSNSYDPSPRHSGDLQQQQPPDSPPPVPPKTPVNGGLPYPANNSPPPLPGRQSSPSNAGPMTFMNIGELGKRLPYPDVEGPPPSVNTANKPQLSQ